MSLRAEKVGSVIKRVLVNPITDLASEYSAGLVTVTSVRMSPDLSIAKVYLSIFKRKGAEPGVFLDILETNKGSLRTSVAKNLKLRHTPELRFFLDDTLDQMQHIQDLLNSVKVEEKNDNNS